MMRESNSTSFRNKNGRRSARSVYCALLLERIAKTQRGLQDIRAARRICGRPVVVPGGRPIPELAGNRVDEGLPVKAPAYPAVQHVSPQSSRGARRAGGERARAFVAAYVLHRKAPRSDAVVPTDCEGNVLVLLEMHARRLAGLLVFEPREIARDAAVFAVSEFAAHARTRVA